MAILKIIAHGLRREAKRKVIQYVLDPKKTQEDLSYVTGDFQAEQITPKTVFQEFQRVRKMFGKDRKGSRTYLHGTVSFAPGELLPDQVKDFTVDLVEQIYPGHQVLVVAHTDTAHPHAHFVVETVSCDNGIMLHTSKQDLERAKKICEKMCRNRGLTVAQKGHHADGTPFEDGEFTAWEKNKYHQLIKDPKKSYLVALALAIEDCADAAQDQGDFCSLMENEYGWTVTWKDSKKNIVFTDSEGHRVRDSNLSKTFNIDVSKEWLTREFERHTTRATAATRAAKGSSPAEEADRTVGSGKRLAEKDPGRNAGPRR
jgi:hypothetical protein